MDERGARRRDFSSIKMSSTGPQMPTWQYAGVPTNSTTGWRAESAERRPTAWNGQAGSRRADRVDALGVASVGVSNTGSG